jgi:hypothetical protein
MISKLKWGIVEGINSLFPAPPQKTVLVAGAPRSGTTWLAELLREMPGYKFMNEPLFLRNNPLAREVGFEWRTHLSPEEEWPDAEAFFENVLSGRVSRGPLWHYQASSSVARLIEHTSNPKLVVKFCRAGRLLHWLLRRFEVLGTVLIIRHPCAVLASQLGHGGWAPDQLAHDIDSEEAVGQMPDEVWDRFGKVLGNISTRLEMMTARWCLDYYIPLIEYADYGHPWVLTPYERLVLDGENEMKCILSTFGAEMTDGIRDQLTSASAYASNDLATDDKRKQLGKWRFRLSKQQIDQILGIVSAFGLDFYTRELEPKYEDLPGYEIGRGAHPSG